MNIKKNVEIHYGKIVNTLTVITIISVFAIDRFSIGGIAFSVAAFAAVLIVIAYFVNLEQNSDGKKRIEGDEDDVSLNVSIPDEAYSVVEVKNVSTTGRIIPKRLHRKAPVSLARIRRTRVGLGETYLYIHGISLEEESMPWELIKYEEEPISIERAVEVYEHFKDRNCTLRLTSQGVEIIPREEREEDAYVTDESHEETAARKDRYIN